jgi:beta-glucanase (GH16 family)
VGAVPAVALAPLAAAPRAPPLTPPPPVRWSLSWSDEFVGGLLNSSLWNIKTNESHCCPAELQLYVPEQVSVADGHLRLRTQRATPAAHGPGGTPYNFTSGWIDTQGKWSQKFGRFEANCSLPPRGAPGVWPAFWLMPEGDPPACWPTGGEVDIFEFNGNKIEDAVFGSYHWAKPGACGKDLEPIPGAAFRPAGSAPDWQVGWHVYAVEWRPDRLDFYVDGKLYLTRKGSRVDLPTSPMHVILNQGVDPDIFPPHGSAPGLYGGQGVSLRVSYVRAYTAASSVQLFDT